MRGIRPTGYVMSFLSHRPWHNSTKRQGAVLIWFAMILTVLVGMTGLVIDTGLLISSQRHAHNAADAGALAAAHDLLYGKPATTATATAITFVKQHHEDLHDAPDPVVNIPPASGPYAGAANYVEVIVTYPRQTFFIHILPGVDSRPIVQARAVAGFEHVTAGEGVAVLDPDARPGLTVTGGGTLKVKGLVAVNSEGGGVDENGVPVDNGNNGVAAAGGNQPDPATGTFASDIRVVGGVDKPENFKNVDPENPASPLRCNQLPIPDPLIHLDTPVVDLGVDPSPRGDPEATNVNLKLNDPSGLNYLEPGPGVDESTMVLHPGVYDSISITGGNVRLVPGIYVISAKKNNQNVLKITGGNVTAEGVMFYNTGSNYNPFTGEPDIYDKLLQTDGTPKKPPPADNADFGSILINASMKFSPIDTTEYDYVNLYEGAKAISTEFDGMLFYQRRLNDQDIDIEGNSEQGMLSGTLYAKWAHCSIAGQGTYDAQFVLGSMDVAGQGDVTIDYSGKELGKAPQVFLVE